jgi:hypothetical protein
MCWTNFWRKKERKKKNNNNNNKKMAAIAMEMAKMLKKLKNTKIIIAGYSPNKNF